MNLRPGRILIVSTCGLVLSLLFPNYAPGQPIDDLHAKAAALETQIEQNGAKVAALGEQLNAAQIKVDQAEATVADAEARIKVAEAETARLKGLINERAAAIYKDAGTSGPFDSINASKTQDIETRSKYTDVAASRDDALINQLAQAEEDLSQQKADAEKARAAAQVERDQLAKDKADADAAANEQQTLLDQTKGQIGELVAQEAAQRQAAAAAAAPKPSAENTAAVKSQTSQTTSAGANWSGPAPNASGGAAAAVAFAEAQVGKPYCYAGTGPDCFDCSGLTMRAWQAGGLSLPHFSGAQGAMFPHVSLDQLQPGDLITTSSWDQHVGIWVGGGYVHATHTGDFVRYVPGAGSVVDAVRPG